MPRVYFTGHRQFHRKDIRLTFHPGEQPSFSAEIDLERYRGVLPDNARVFVEAYHNTMIQRFDFGIISECRPPGNLLLTDFDAWDYPRFRVGIVDTEQDPGRLLCSLERVRAVTEDDHESGGESLLKLRGKPRSEMGGELWCVEDVTGSYELVYNKDLPSLEGRIKGREPLVLGLILPPAVREILFRELMVRNAIPEDSEWVRFGIALAGEPPPERVDDEEANENIESWIDDVVKSFCAQRGQFFERLEQQERDGGSGLSE